jgi:hypothetical protein
MKKIIISLSVILILAGSCKNWIDPDMNIDPNNPTDVGLAQLLAPAEVNLAYIVGGELARYDCTWMQQIAGLQSQAADVDVYNITEAEINNAWSWNLYAPGMINCKIMMGKAESTNSPHYAGVAKILMAYHLGVTTDHWGDIPYSDALKGGDNYFESKYDTQQQIYTTIFTLLNEAITDLQASSSVFSPGSEDLIYGGDLVKWTKAAYALKARYSLHLSKKNGATSYSDALAAVAKAFTANEDDLRLDYGTAYNNSNPIYQSEQERPGYYSANSTMINMLNASGDPRRDVYFTGTTGSVSGVPNTSAAVIGPGYSSTDSPVNFISYAEVKFIEAEARFKLNPSDPLALNACNDGIKASLQREGVYGDGSWYNSHKLSSGSLNLQNIMIQKYLSSFLQVESWTDWRRTGYPILSLATGAMTTQIPRRYPYPQDERLYNNSNMPSGVNITDKVWWDNAK